MSHTRPVVPDNDNIKRAEMILDEIKKNVVGLQDRVSAELYYLYVNGRIDSSLTLKISMAIQHQQARIHVLRKVADAVLGTCADQFSLDINNGRYNRIRQRLAIASFGYGECSEQTDLAIYKLLQAGIQSPIYFIGAQSGKFELFANHGFAIIGDCSNLKQTNIQSTQALIQAIQSLPEDCLIVDTFFNLVVSARHIPDILKNAFTLFNINRIDCVEQMNYIAGDLSDLAKDSNLLIQQMQRYIPGDQFREMRLYRGLLDDYKTVHCEPAAPEDVKHLFQQLNFENEQPKPLQQMITNPLKKQISFLRTWLRTTDRARVEEVADKLNAPELRRN